jgi:hypothetical protein
MPDLQQLLVLLKDFSWLVELAGTALVTLVAAYGGAKYAFRLQDRARERETRGDQRAAVNRAQFALIRQYNMLRNIQKQFVDPIRNHEGRFLAMRPALGLTEAPKPIDLDSLSFLLETDDRDFPLRLMLEQENLDILIRTLQERSRLHLERAQPKLAAAGIEEGKEYTPAVIIGALGIDLFRQLERITESTITRVDEGVISCRDLIAAFHTAMKQHFPKETIICLGPD